MSNKETLQQNNLRLNENNNDLTSILNKINTLPSIEIPEELNITSSTEQQSYEGLYNKVNVTPIIAQGTYIMPSNETQKKEGLFNVVTVAGDENLIAENIKEGVTIFGVEGEAETTNVKITDASYLFYGGSRTDYLEELLKLCENVTSTKNMFNSSKVTSLDLSNFNTSNVTTMSNMFSDCRNITSLNLSNFNTSNLTNMERIFYSCSNLTELNISNFDTSNVTNMRDIFLNCSKLENLISFKNLGKGYTQKSSNYTNYKLSLSSCTKLTYESLMDVINNLYDLNLTYDVANGGTLYTQQLVLGNTNKAKLTAEEIAIATNKGWTVS